MESEGKIRYIAFDAVEIDLVSRRVTVAGVETVLEPKAFDVLALLARTPDKVFTRDEILDAVWGHRHITPSVLSRAILLIRQALGDSANGLRTLRGIGYRFDADVVASASRTATTLAQETTSSATPAAFDLKQTFGDKVPTSASPALVSDVAGSAALTPTADTALPRPAPTRMRFRPTRRQWALVATLGALAIAAIALHAWRPAEAPPTLVVLPLQAIGDEKNGSAFADGLSEELTTQLAQVDGLRTISSISAERAQHDGFDAAQLAERLHVTHALEGSLRETGGKLRIDLRLIETPSGHAVWSQGYDRTANDIFGVQQEIAQAVASALSLRMKLVRSTTSPPDPDVFREYLELRHLLVAHSRGPVYDKAGVALIALAARAPDYAPVHGLLALEFATHFLPGSEQEALYEARQALKIDPDSVDAHAALGELACLRYEWHDCLKELRAALALNPADPPMNMLVGMRLARLGYGEEALRHFKIAHATDPLSYWTNANLGTELDVLGRSEDARPYLDTLQSLDPTSSRTGNLRWSNAVLRNDLSGARDIAAKMSDDDPWKASFLAVGEALAVPTAWPDALKKLQAAQEKTGNPRWLMLLTPQPDVTMALRMYEDNNIFGGKYIWSREFAAIRPDPAFSDFLRRTKTIDYWKANGWPPQCKPDGDGARCD